MGYRIVQYEAQELDKARTIEEARAKKKKWEEKFPSSTVAIWDATGHRIELEKLKRVVQTAYDQLQNDGLTKDGAYNLALKWVLEQIEALE